MIALVTYVTSAGQTARVIDATDDGDLLAQLEAQHGHKVTVISKIPTGDLPYLPGRTAR